MMYNSTKDSKSRLFQLALGFIYAPF